MEVSPRVIRDGGAVSAGARRSKSELCGPCCRVADAAGKLMADQGHERRKRCPDGAPGGVLPQRAHYFSGSSPRYEEECVFLPNRWLVGGWSDALSGAWIVWRTRDLRPGRALRLAEGAIFSMVRTKGRHMQQTNKMDNYAVVRWPDDLGVAGGAGEMRY
ncbi:hypothetical protein NDU88_005981 [Pleurodeles waltl]|uniref:Uncharacterized protein n=1 Tax=Pleurodeles waltl TaxID=8319 RepID=A0AAV7VNN7_PLEWA|nr:hypothetical protein NDU88_005981 [Pleurodeles waltl]